MGGDMSTLRERCEKASPDHYVGKNTCPIAIFHGDVAELRTQMRSAGIQVSAGEPVRLG